MRRGFPAPAVTLAPPERRTLEMWAARRKTAQALAQRARVVLLAAENRSNTEIARELQLTRVTVGKWRQRFVAQRVAGLLDEPKPGAPRRIGDSKVDRVITMTLESTPQNATHWST